MSKKPVFDLWNPAAAPENWVQFSVKPKEGCIGGICAEDGVGVIWVDRLEDELLVQFRGYLLASHQTEWVGKAVDGMSLKIGMTKDQVVTVSVDDRVVFACRINKPSYRGLNFRFFTEQKVADLEIYNGARRDSDKSLTSYSTEVAEAVNEYWVGLITQDQAETRIAEVRLAVFAFFPEETQERSDLYVKIRDAYGRLRQTENTASQ